MLIVCSGGDKLEFVPASSQLLFSPTSVEVLVDSGWLPVNVDLCRRAFL